MSVEERDPHTGYKTTGHEWNGITELNTPVPRPVWYFLGAAFAFAVVYWILMPAWPTGVSYTKGLLGFDQRTAVEASLERASADRNAWASEIEQKSYASIMADPVLMKIVRESGHQVFGDNCAACHRSDARGQPGFPNLKDNVWLWGGSPDTIAETIRLGVNSGHKEGRVSEMTAFGRDGFLPTGDIRDVVAYVRTLNGASTASDAAVKHGAEVFAANCVSCHGEHAQGDMTKGIPNLTDNDWLYGGSEDAIYQSVWGGRRGQMPSWDGRLSLLDQRILVLYLLDHQEAQP